MSRAPNVQAAAASTTTLVLSLCPRTPDTLTLFGPLPPSLTPPLRSLRLLPSLPAPTTNTTQALQLPATSPSQATCPAPSPPSRLATPCWSTPPNSSSPCPWCTTTWVACGTLCGTCTRLATRQTRAACWRHPGWRSLARSCWGHLLQSASCSQYCSAWLIDWLRGGTWSSCCGQGVEVGGCVNV